MNKKIIIMSMLLLLAFSVAFAAYEGEECIICDLMIDEPQSNMLLTEDKTAETYGIKLYYENYSNTPSRTSIENSMLFVYVVPAEGEKELLRIYTNEDGEALFDFSEYAAIAQEEQITYLFTIIYCPFCHPSDPGYPCGFDECVEYTGIEVPPGITGPDPISLIPLAEGVTEPTTEELNTRHFLPSSVSTTHVPPPQPESRVPAFCLPLILIFALLGGALYYTGRNPFAAFSLGTPRAGIGGRHIKYTPGGRGLSLSGSYIAQQMAGAVREGKAMKAYRKAKKAGDKEGMKEAAKGLVKPASWKNTLSFGLHGAIFGEKGGKAVAGAKGGVTESRGGIVGLIRRGKKMRGERRIKTKTAKSFTTPSGRKALGLEGGAKGRLKGWAKTTGEAMTHVLGGLLSKSFLSCFGLQGVAERMQKYVINKNATATARGDAESAVAAEDQQRIVNKLSKLVQEKKATEITVSGKTFYEMKEKGHTTRIDKEAWQKGDLKATETFSRGGVAIERSYSGGYALNEQTGEMEFTTPKLDTVSYTKEIDGKPITVTYGIEARDVPSFAGVEAMVPAEDHLKIIGVSGAEEIKQGTEAFQKVSDFAEKYNGKPISADVVAKTFAGMGIEKGVTISSMTNDLGAAQQKLDYAANNVVETQKTISLRTYNKTNPEFNDATKKIETKSNDVIVDTGKKALTLIANTPPDESTGGHFETQATRGWYREGGEIFSEKYEKPSEANVRGTEAIYSLGVTGLATMTKKEAIKAVETQLDKSGVTGARKTEAIATAKEIYKDARGSAVAWNNASTEAAVTYHKLNDITADALKPLYERGIKEPAVSPETKYDITHTTVISAVSSHLSAPEATQYKREEIGKAVIGAGGTTFAKTPEQKFLATSIRDGLYKMPKKPEMPVYEGVTKPKPEQMLDDWYKKLKIEERIIVDADLELMKNKKRAEELKNRMTVSDAEMRKWKDWEAKKKDIFYGDGQATAAVASLTVTSAIQKGVKLPKSVYDDALVGIGTRNPERWKDAANTTAKEITKSAREKEEEGYQRMVSQAERLKKEKKKSD